MRAVRQSKRSRNSDGAALTVAVLAIGGLIALSGSLLVVNLANARAERAVREEISAKFVTQAALTHSLYQLRRGQAGDIGTRDEPVEWGGFRYWADATSLGNRLWRLRGTGLDARTGHSMELVVREVPTSIWTHGAFGLEYVHMDSNAKTDSFDSRRGAYAGQATNGNGSDQHAGSAGHVGSNGPITMDSNSQVWGDAAAGPGRTTTISGNAQVSGSTTPASAALAMPTISVPAFPSSGNLTVNSNRTIGPGDLGYGSIRANASKVLTVVGPARIVCSNLELNSNSQLLVNAANGPVEFWVRQNFILDSNVTMRSTGYDPTRVRVNLLSNNVTSSHQVRMDSNASFYGTLLAPSARIVINSNFQLYGSCMARSIELDSNAFFHFDEALLDVAGAGAPSYDVLVWREIPFLGGPGLATCEGGCSACQVGSCPQHASAGGASQPGSVTR
jgi:hypothetical protein